MLAAVGGRLDLALVQALRARGHAVSRSELLRAFAAGGVSAGGEPLKASHPVDRELRVEVELPARPAVVVAAEPIALSLLWEDDDLLVIDKPAGMVVHAGVGHPRGTLVNAVLHHLGVGPEALPHLPGSDGSRPGIVHRLDRDTSGAMVVVKTEPALRALHARFRAHALERRYVGVVEGVPDPRARTIETTHGRDPRDRRRFCTRVGGRRAVTHLEVERVLVEAALVGFVLETGRTHQIRMHAAHLGHPILGDALYGRPASDARVRREVAALGRHALHAEVLGFPHPRTGAPLRFRAPRPAGIVALVEALTEPEAVP